MTDQGTTPHLGQARTENLYDQDRFDEDGYFSNAPIGLRRAPQRQAQRVAVTPVRSRAGSRRARRAQKAARKANLYRPRRRTQGIWLPLLVFLASIGGLAYVANERWGTVAADAPVETPLAGTPVPIADVTAALFVHTDGSGSTIGFTVASVHSDTAADVVFVPASTMVEIPGFGLDTLRQAGDFGGVDLAALAISNLLTIEFDHLVELTPAASSELTRSFDPLLVENPGRIDAIGSDDRVEVLYPKGAMLLASGDTADFLSRRALDESELDRLVRHQEFWVAYLLARSEVVATDRDVVADAEHFIDELSVRRLDLDYRILDVQLIGGEDELYGVDRDRLPAVIAQLDPNRDATVAPTGVQLLNGVGVPGLSPPITEMLVAAGASVQLTDNANRFDHDITQIVYYRDDQFEAAQEIRDALGVGDIVKAIEPIDVVDVTVVIGRDLVAATDVVQGSVAPIAERDVEFGPDSGQNEGTALGE